MPKASFCLAAFFAVLLVDDARALERFSTWWGFRTDDSWRVTSVSPPGGWNTDFNFDDSGPEWVVPWTNGAHRIWHTTNRSRQSPKHIWFRRVLFLDEREANVERLLIFARFDDNGSVYVNGTRVVHDTGGGASQFYFDLDPGLLHPGWNVLAGTGENTIHPYNNAEVHLGAYVPTDNRPSPIIPFGAEWKYLDDGSNQRSLWRALDFDDSAWLAGPAELGYGDGDEATVVGYGGDINNKYVTTYFRKRFEVANLDGLIDAEIRLRRDDGAAVYLNGAEAARTNLGATASFDQWANGITDDGEVTHAYAVPLERLVEGDNVLAVEVHQADPASSDLSFDLELRGLREADMARLVPLPVSNDFDALSISARNAMSSGGRLGFRTTGVLSGGERGVTERGEYIAQNSRGEFSILFDPVDLAGKSNVFVSVDARSWEDSPLSNFESDDFFRADVRMFTHHVLKRTISVFVVAGSDSGAGDRLKELDKGGEFGRLTTFRRQLPDGYTSAQLVVKGRTNSLSERLFIDNVAFVPSTSVFIRGRANADGVFDISDAVFIIRVLFLGEGRFPCEKAADVTDSGRVDISDAIFLLNFLFMEGPRVHAPFPDCGEDSTPDALTCDRFEECE